MREASTHKIYFSTPFADISLLGVICTRLSLWPFLWCRMCFPTEQTLEQFHRSEVPNFIFIFLLSRCCWQWHSNRSWPCTRLKLFTQWLHTARSLYMRIWDPNLPAFLPCPLTLPVCSLPLQYFSAGQTQAGIWGQVQTSVCWDIGWGTGWYHLWAFNFQP